MLQNYWRCIILGVTGAQATPAEMGAQKFYGTFGAVPPQSSPKGSKAKGRVPFRSARIRRRATGFNNYQESPKAPREEGSWRLLAAKSHVP